MEVGLDIDASNVEMIKLQIKTTGSDGSDQIYFKNVQFDGLTY